MHGVVTISELVARGKLPFDPRSTGSTDAVGRWPDSFRHSDPEANERQNAAARALEGSVGRSEAPPRLTSEFVSKVVEEGGARAPGALGNTRAAWSSAEGFDSTEYCDGISDWWPEDWTMPVGYHVTLPCDKDQAGYKTFDAAFAVERPNNRVNVIMRYAHSTFRDQDDYHSTFGTAGFCRKGSYGMPRSVTNTMRLCTVDSVNVEYDATVPIRPRFSGNGFEQFSSTEYCSETPYEVPWAVDSRDVTHPSMFSVGNVPMYR